MIPMPMKRSKKYHKRPDGKIAVSLVLPEDLVNKLQRLADREHRSRNGQAVAIIEEWLDMNDPKLTPR